MKVITQQRHIYLFNLSVTVVTDQHQGNVYEVVNMCYRQRRTIFIDSDLDRVTRNKKTM